MTDSRPIAPAIQALLDEALPNDHGMHTLILPEMHKFPEARERQQEHHLDYLRPHLKNLKEKHNLQTIGLELRGYTNLFMWAYQDGTLEAELGSKAQAKEYIRAVLLAELKPETNRLDARHVIAQADLATDALDPENDIAIAAYDSRGRFSDRQQRTSKQLNLFNEWLEHTSTRRNISTETLLHQIRETPRQYAEFWSPGMRLGWLQQEMNWLLEKHPHYQTRLDAIEHLLDVGYQKIGEGKLTSDALSAVLFDALSSDGNRLPVIGWGHIDGIGDFFTDDRGTLLSHPVDKKPNLETVHGTFGHHLFAVGQSLESRRPHSVTQAFIAGTGIANEIVYRFNQNIEHPQVRIVNDAPIRLARIDTGEVSYLPHPAPYDTRMIPLEEKFPVVTPKPTFFQRVTGKKAPPAPSAEEVDTHQQNHVNPLLMPEIKQAYDAVRVAMYGEPERHR